MKLKREYSVPVRSAAWGIVMFSAVATHLLFLAVPANAELNVHPRGRNQARQQDGLVRMTNNSSYTVQYLDSKNPNQPERINSVDYNGKPLKSKSTGGTMSVYGSRESNLRTSTSTSTAKKGSTWDDDRQFNQISINTIPMLSKGIGLRYERRLMDRLTLGPSFMTAGGTYESDQNEGPKFTIDYRYYQYALNSRFYLTGNADESAVYLLGSANYMDAQVMADFSGVKSAPEKIRAFGGAVGLGGQLVGSYVGSHSRLLCNLGLTYGSVNRIRSQVIRGTSGSTVVDAETSSTAEAGLAVEASIGLLF